MPSNDQENVGVAEVDIEEARNNDESAPTTGSASDSVTPANATDDEPEVDVVDTDDKPPATKKKNSVVINEGGNQTKDDNDEKESCLLLSHY
jgi:hypothetical protein